MMLATGEAEGEGGGGGGVSSGAPARSALLQREREGDDGQE